MTGGTAHLGGLNMTPEDMQGIKRIIITACGTSWHAALIGKYVLESMSRIPVDVEYASEFRYRDPVIGEGTVVFVISQSGETADTLAALRTGPGEGCGMLRHRERRGFHDSPGDERRRLHPCRTRDRCGLHKGFHQSR
ncbi:MAG: SIS domain-containing protein [Rhodopseudomonas palustris]|nr:SIS domain-containing protein [Rhodopseudomonas palustris]